MYGIWHIVLWPINSNVCVSIKHINLLNQTQYSTCFSHPWPYLGLQVHLGIKLHALMPKDGWGWPTHITCNVGFNKFVALDSSKSIPIYINGDTEATLVLKITVQVSVVASHLIPSC